MNKEMLIWMLRMLGFLIMLTIPITYASTIVHAVDFDQEISEEDQAKFNEILTPVMKIYNLVKYAASLIGAMVLLFAAITFMTSGADPKKRDTAKNMGMYVIIGLVVIWATPLAVQYIL